MSRSRPLGRSCDLGVYVKAGEHFSLGLVNGFSRWDVALCGQPQAAEMKTREEIT